MMAKMPTEEQIRERAFELYKERGEESGHAGEDWEQAKFEVAHLPLRVVHLRPLGRRPRRNASGDAKTLARIVSRIRGKRRA